MDTAEEQRRARLVIASNRGPVERRTGPDGEVVRHRGAGGLIAVLGPALASHGGVWVASALTEEDRAAAREAEGSAPDVLVLPEGPIGVRLLAHDPEAYAGYYGAVSTELLWFLQHHLREPGTPRTADADLHAQWGHYRTVNDAFARACAAEAQPGGTVLLQDYHLSLAPRRLRALRPDVRSAHFTMTPWAEPEQFAALPAELRRELVDGLLGADMVCFLVPRWADAFLACCAELGLAVDRTARSVRDAGGRAVAVRCFPVGVDETALRARAAEPDVQRYEADLRALAGDARLVVRVDRMEPSKNIVRGLDAYARFLQAHPERHGRVVHYVLAYASRGELEAYREYAARVETLTREINRTFGTDGWQPVVLETRNDFGRGLAAMALADVLVVNPLRDGMNLVAKEGAVVGRRGPALVLSRHAGAADDLAEGCTLVDPWDPGELAEAIEASLRLPHAERALRLGRLRRGAAALPPDRWLAAALTELERVAPEGAAGAPGGPEAPGGSGGPVRPDDRCPPE
ncbi:trehalose-6-phosphate synthase [Streptomyces sp. JJ36]|uniref:alpha,alpha-trehalose-phosphate synthase (UDP-forming) n=1 Tax=Streptomyces sp. JJ36 TaxID=2736645 RepID=UPI001F2DF95C|nr:trehalose-6-phosphate synthase [Streptomyces sp. JJ36]MCF6523715.1 trehalose-6-phosphate synthase [Streptomyces sp. JJ36]